MEITIWSWIAFNLFILAMLTLSALPAGPAVRLRGDGLGT